MCPRWLPPFVCSLACLAGALFLLARVSRTAAAAESASSSVAEALAAGNAEVIVFSRTKGFRHKCIPQGNQMLEELCRELGVKTLATEDPKVFNETSLARVRLVVFNNTTGDVLNDTQQTAFEAFIRRGGGFVGIHAASDTEYGWEFYGQLVGVYFASHPDIQEGQLTVVEPRDGSTEGLPNPWVRRDEWYNFKALPPPSARRLVLLDEGSYRGGNMGAEHPISWSQEVHGGRAWYTAMGHTEAGYAEPEFRAHVKGGLAWALNLESAVKP